MNIQEYISSGILESYILGHATPEERREVMKYAAMYPEVKTELEEIEKALNNYATEHSVAPPAYMEEKILDKIKNQSRGITTAKDVMVRHLPSRKESRWTSNFSFGSVAAILLILISVGSATYLGFKNSRLEGTFDKLTKANNVLSDSIRNLSSNISQMKNDLAILKDPMYKIVELKGLKLSPNAKAMVCWCPQDKKVYIEIDNFPPPPQGMQYQLWAIVDGKPVSEGMLSLGNGLHQMPDVNNVQAFEITLEKAGGNPSPKGDTYVSGAI